jgi:hypothetical protein
LETTAGKDQALVGVIGSDREALLVLPDAMRAEFRHGFGIESSH